MSCASSSVPPRSNQDVVWDFRTTGTTDWRPLNDGVMGGKSSSTLSSTRDGVEFTGEVNTNGGGFASFRTLRVNVLTLALWWQRFTNSQFQEVLEHANTS